MAHESPIKTYSDDHMIPYTHGGGDSLLFDSILGFRAADRAPARKGIGTSRNTGAIFYSNFCFANTRLRLTH